MWVPRQLASNLAGGLEVWHAIFTVHKCCAEQIQCNSQGPYPTSSNANTIRGDLVLKARKPKRLISRLQNISASSEPKSSSRKPAGVIGAL